MSYQDQLDQEQSREEKEREERSREAANKWEAAKLFIMKNERGRDFVTELLNRCHVFDYYRSPLDHAEMAYLEGQRAIGMRLLDELKETYPQNIMQIILDQKS